MLPCAICSTGIVLLFLLCVLLGACSFFEFCEKPGTPQIIRDMAAEYEIELHWDGSGDSGEEGGWSKQEKLRVGETYAFNTAAAFLRRGLTENENGEMFPADLSVAIVPVVEVPDGYTLVSVGVNGEATASLTKADSSPGCVVRSGSAYL